MRLPRPPQVALGLGVAGAAAFTAGTAHWADQPFEDPATGAEIRAIPPPPAAVAMAFGDAYLAADLVTVRAAVAMDHLDGKRDEAQLARLLGLSLNLNPAHEDAYYLMEAMLPWQGRVERAQELLRMAERARPWDWMPPFFRAFNRYYFHREPIAGARILNVAAERAGPRRAAGLRAMAGRWSALGRSPQRALEMVKAMAQGAASGPLRRNLDKRAQQLRGLIRLRKAARVFREQKGIPPADLETLEGYGGLEEIPIDPTGDGYIVDESGQIRVRPPNFDRIRTPGERRGE